MPKMKQAGDSRAQNSLPIRFPQQGCIGLFPLIVALTISGIEVLIAFVDMIASASSKALVESKGVLSAGTMQFHLTWGIVLSISLQFIENSLRWMLGRKCCNAFGSITGTLCGIYLVACVYTWVWANDGAGVQLISKYFLVALGVRTSPDQMMQLAYSGGIKLAFDLVVSWMFPVQCVVVTVDCLISMCRQKQVQVVDVIFKTDAKGIQCKVDHKKLYQEDKKD